MVVMFCNKYHFVQNVNWYENELRFQTELHYVE